jgi:hypothetical protein
LDIVLEDALGEDYVTVASLKNIKTEEARQVEVEGIFCTIWYIPIDRCLIFRGFAIQGS